MAEPDSQLATAVDPTTSRPRLSDILRRTVSSSPGKAKPSRSWLPWKGHPSISGSGGAEAGNLDEAASWERGAQRLELKPLAAGDMLFPTRLLLPRLHGPSNLACICTTFCEVMTLDFDRFNATFVQHYPAQLRELRIQAAIYEDSEESLAWALKSSSSEHGLSSEQRDLLVHDCARLGAARCIRWLVGVNGCSLDRRDSNGRTPLEVAQMGCQKAALDALVLEGALAATHTAAHAERDVLPEGAESSELRRPPVHLAKLLEATPQSESCEALRARLEAAGLDLTTWEVDKGVKGVEELHKELQQGYGSCVWSVELGKLVRILCIVRLRVVADCGGSEKVLTETEEQWWLGSSGQALRLPMRKMRTGPEGFEATLGELWSSCLGVESSLVDQLFERGAEHVYEEVKASGSYPGLATVYVVHEVPYWARPESKVLGLPEGRSFEMREAKSGSGSAGQRRVYAWLEVSTPQSPPTESSTKK
ncbi:unnamed protein product, partial [Polarella glacialis]